MQKKIYIINGPNLNLLGQREPDKYGKTSLEELKSLCLKKCKKYNFKLCFFQSHMEGLLIDVDRLNKKKISW